MNEPERLHRGLSQAIPTEFSRRKRLWIYSSLWLTHVDRLFASLEHDEHGSGGFDGVFSEQRINERMAQVLARMPIIGDRRVSPSLANSGTKSKAYVFDGASDDRLANKNFFACENSGLLA